MTTPALERSRLHALPSALLYQIMKLRCDVFVVEQELICEELDGRDLEASTWLIYALENPAAPAAIDNPVVATARILVDDHQVAIGRVAVAKSHRGTGLGRDLVQYAIDVCRELHPEMGIYVGAQAHLEQWYGNFGLERAGEHYLDAGIDHVPMRLAPVQ